MTREYWIRKENFTRTWCATCSCGWVGGSRKRVADVLADFAEHECIPDGEA